MWVITKEKNKNSGDLSLSFPRNGLFRGLIHHVEWVSPFEPQGRAAAPVQEYSRVISKSRPHIDSS